MRTNVGVDKKSPEYLARQVATSRYNLLLIVIFTVVNLLNLVLEQNSYFLFSASVPYYTTAVCMVRDLAATGSIFGTFATVSLVVSAVILGVYLLCWFMSKKKSGWFIVALVLFAVDTVALVGFTLLLDMVGESVLDYVFHAWVIYSLIQAVNCSRKLKALEARKAIPADPYAPTPTDYYGANPEL